MAQAAEMTSNIAPASKPETLPAATAGWDPFESLRRGIDRLFDDFGRGTSLAPLRRPLADLDAFWRGMPATDIAETDGAYELTVELPGIDEKNVEVKLAGGTLTISGEKREESEKKDKNYTLSERRYGSFSRSFTLPDSVDAAKIEAHCKDGVLTVTLPKKPEAKAPARRIDVKAK